MRAGRSNLGLPLRLFFFLVLVGSLIAPQAASFLATRATDPMTSPAGSRAVFKVKGTVKGLYPGLKKRLPLKLKNRAKYAIKVQTLTIKRKKTGVMKCPKRLLRVKKFVRPNMKVRPGRTGKAKAWVKLAAKAPNACKNVTFPVAYQAEAVKR